MKLQTKIAFLAVIAAGVGMFAYGIHGYNENLKIDEAKSEQAFQKMISRDKMTTESASEREPEETTDTTVENPTYTESTPENKETTESSPTESSDNGRVITKEEVEANPDQAALARELLKNDPEYQDLMREFDENKAKSNSENGYNEEGTEYTGEQ